MFMARVIDSLCQRSDTGPYAIRLNDKSLPVGEAFVVCGMQVMPWRPCRLREYV